MSAAGFEPGSSRSQADSLTSRPSWESAPEPPPVLVQEAGTLVTSQYRPSECLVTRHLPGSGEDADARARALAERCRLEQLKEEAQQQEAERLKRAAERGKVAEERQKLIQTRDRLAKLMNRDALHAFYRGEDVSGYLNEALQETNRSLLEFPSPNGSRLVITSDRTDCLTHRRDVLTGRGTSIDPVDRCERMTSDDTCGISGAESTTELSGVDGCIGISGMDSVSGISRLTIGGKLADIESSTSSVSNAESARGISGADASETNSEHPSSYGINSNRGVSACDETSDAQGSVSADSVTGRPSVHTTSSDRAAPHIVSQDSLSSRCSSGSDFDALVALQQAEELMTKVRQMKEERSGLNFRQEWPAGSGDLATSRYDQERDADFSDSWRTVVSKDERLDSHRSDFSSRNLALVKKNQRNLLSHRQLASSSDRLLSSQLNGVDSGEREMYSTETSSFDEEIGVLLKFNEESSDIEQRQDTDCPTVGPDDNLDKSLQYIKRMKSSLGMAANPVNKKIVPPSVQLPDQVCRNLQLLKQNRKTIENKLEAAVRGRGVEPRNRRRQRSRGEASNRVRLLKGAAAVTSEISSENPFPEIRSHAPRTRPPHIPLDINDGIHSSKVLDSHLPRTEIPCTFSSTDDSVSVSNAFVTPGTSSSFSSVTTPVRMYREEVKEDGSGERPLRKRDKFELQKRIVLQNYIKRLLDTRRSDVLSSSSVEGSGIDVSSVKVLAKLAGGTISVDSPTSSTGMTMSDKDDRSSSSSEPSHGVSKGQAVTSTLDRLTDEQELDRVPSRLSDIEEQSRLEVGVQVPSERPPISVRKDGRNMAVQVPSVEDSNSSASIPGYEASVAPSSRTPVSEISSDKFISLSQQPKFDAVSPSSSLEMNNASIYSRKLVFSNSSVTLPTFPSTSTPTVGDNVPKVSGAVSSNVSPIVNEDAISTVDQISSDQFQGGYSSDQFLRSRPDADYQILNRNLQKVKSSSDEAQRPLHIPQEVVNVSTRSADDVASLNSDELDVASSSLLSSEVFSELSPEKLRAKKEAIEKKKAIYLRLLELNEIKQQYMMLHQQEDEYTSAEKVDHRGSEKLSSDETVPHDTSSVQLISGESNTHHEESNRVELSVSDSRGMFQVDTPVPPGGLSLKDLQRHQEHLHRDHHQRYHALIDNHSRLQQELAARAQAKNEKKRLKSQNLLIDQNSPDFETVGDSSSSQYYSHAGSAKEGSSETESVVDRLSGEWATTEGSNQLEKSNGSPRMENKNASCISPSFVSSSRSRTVFDHGSTQDFTSIEISEGLISPVETHHSPLVTEVTRTSNDNTESLEEGLLSTVDQHIATGSILDENDQHSRNDTLLKTSGPIFANESFKKLLEMVNLRKLSGFSDLQQVPQLGNSQAEFDATHSNSGQPSVDGSTSSVRNMSDDWLEHAYDADHSSKGTTSSAHSDVDVVSEKVAEQLKRIEGMLRSGNNASAATASTSSGDTLLADLGSNVASGAVGSSSPSDLEEVFRKYGWARGMLNKMNSGHWTEISKHVWALFIPISDHHKYEDGSYQAQRRTPRTERVSSSNLTSRTQSWSGEFVKLLLIVHHNRHSKHGNNNSRDIRKANPSINSKDSNRKAPHQNEILNHGIDKQLPEN
ncbi:hypothetical protein FHG87_015174 [Trinorchestia longiramus]|nr:hypothetical protein FHG87_015174 [Trinorchestia longiramus]